MTRKTKTNATPIFSYEKVTPKYAAQILANNKWASEAEVEVCSGVTFKQRDISSVHVAKIQRAYDEGTWHPYTGDAVKLSQVTVGGETREVLPDGQHRMSAVIKHGKPIEMCVCRYVPLDAFPYMDQGKPRSAKDIMRSAGWSHADECATMARLWFREDKSGDPRVNNEDNRASEASIVEHALPMQEHFYAVIAEFGTAAKTAVRSRVAAHRPGFLYSVARFIHETGNWDEARSVVSYLSNTEERTAPRKSWAVFARTMREILRDMDEAEKKGAKNAQLNAPKCDYIVTGLPIAWNASRASRPPSVTALRNHIENAMPKSRFVPFDVDLLS